MANATHGLGNAGWVAEPLTRGTASLLWSCVSTTLICTWSALHLNVPPERYSPSRAFLRTFKAFAFALVAPEAVAGSACVEWANAGKLTKNMRTEAELSEWSGALSFFVCMGGVAIRRPSGQMIRLEAKHLSPLVHKGLLEVSSMSEKAVNDKSKANWFAKAIAAVQVTWFLSQSIGRAVSRLPITTLEFFTLAYVTCAIGAYAFWWHKPFQVQSPLVVGIKPSITREDKALLPTENREPTALISQSVDETVPFSYLYSCCGLFSVLFGLCHLLAWSAEFPSPTEQLLWRVGSVSCLAIPVIFIIFLWVDERWSVMRRYWCYPANLCGNSIVTLSICFYVLVRLFFLFEVFFALRSVPARVYDTVQWAQCIPHI